MFRYFRSDHQQYSFSFLDHCILMRVCILIELAKTWLKSDSKKWEIVPKEQGNSSSKVHAFSSDRTRKILVIIDTHYTSDDYIRYIFLDHSSGIRLSSGNLLVQLNKLCDQLLNTYLSVIVQKSTNCIVDKTSIFKHFIG